MELVKALQENISVILVILHMYMCYNFFNIVST